MSIQDQIDRIDQNIADTYSVLSEKGATMPEEQNSNNLAQTARTVPQGDGSVGVSVQSDYTEDNSSSPAYIKNRPFYEGRVASHFSAAETPSPISFITAIGYTFFKVFDFTLDTNQILTADFIFKQNNQVITELRPISQNLVFQSEDGIILYFTLTDSPWSQFCYYIAYKAGTIPVDFMGMPLEITVPETGIYVALESSTFPSLGTVDIFYDGIKKIDEKFLPASFAQADYAEGNPAESSYIKNRPFYEGKVGFHFSAAETPDPPSYDFVILGMSITAIKLSDYVPLPEELSTIRATIKGLTDDPVTFTKNDVNYTDLFDGAAVQITTIDEPEVSSVIVQKAGTYFVEEEFGETVVRVSIELPEPGWYLMLDTEELKAQLPNLVIDVEYEGIKRLEEKFLPHTAQPDYGENNPFSAAHIKNRPFYAKQFFSNFNTIETPNPVSVDIPEMGFTTYKVSDLTPTKADLLSTAKFGINASPTEVVNIAAIQFESDDFISFMLPSGHGFAIVYKKGEISCDYEGQTITIEVPETGTYIAFPLGFSLPSPLFVHIEYEEIKKIDSKFLPKASGDVGVKLIVLEANWDMNDSTEVLLTDTQIEEIEEIIRSGEVAVLRIDMNFFGVSFSMFFQHLGIGSFYTQMVNNYDNFNLYQVSIDLTEKKAIFYTFQYSVPEATPTTYGLRRPTKTTVAEFMEMLWQSAISRGFVKNITG